MANFNKNILRQVGGFCVTLLGVTVLAAEEGQRTSLRKLSSTDLEDNQLEAAGSQQTTRQCRFISEIICETTVFSSFCELLEDSDMKDQIDDFDSAWTAFVPTNSALESIDLTNLILPSNETDADPLTDLLRFHLIPERLVTGVDLICGGTQVMDNQRETTVVCGEDDSVFLFGKGNSVERGLPQVVVTDVVACNGLIHVISGVLDAGDDPLPPPTTTDEGEEPDQKPKDPDDEIPGVDNSLILPPSGCKTIQEVICAVDELASMCTFLTDERILNPTTSIDLWTIFAPTNQAFEDIVDVLGLLSTDEVLDLLKYHTVPGQELFSGDLVCETDLVMGNSKSSRTKCSSYTLDVFQEGPGNSQPLNPRIIDTDKTACNGVVHVVDHVMVPEQEIMARASATEAPTAAESSKKPSKWENPKNAKSEDIAKWTKSPSYNR